MTHSSNLMHKEHFHFIGIGGAGMAPLAAILLCKGAKVSGSDLISNEKIEKLQSLGAKIFIGHNRDNLSKETSKVVYSSAVKEDNAELSFARELNICCINRGTMLSQIAQSYKRVVAISASHGKSSITSMLSHVVRDNNIDAAYLIGGEAINRESYNVGDGDIFITEVDESDGTHTLINSYLGVVPNVEDDHSWSVGGEEQLKNNFIEFAKKCQNLLIFDTPELNNLFEEHPNLIAIKRPASDDFFILNTAIVVAAAKELNISQDKVLKSMESFSGVARRMTLHGKCKNAVLIEDYAHHPTELRSLIASLNNRYPNYYIRMIFQPHRYNRLKKYFYDFANELKKVNSVIITPTFTAWTDNCDEPIEENLAKEIGSNACYLDFSWQEIANFAIKDLQENKQTLLVIVGAGDINKIISYLLKMC